MPNDPQSADSQKLFDEPYDFNQCTIQVSMQILPRGEGADRQVVIGVRNHQDAPIVRTAPLSTLTLPAILSEMLTLLELDMPARKLLKIERELKEKEEAERRKAKPLQKGKGKGTGKPAAQPAPRPPAGKVAASDAPGDVPQPAADTAPMSQMTLF